MFIMRYWKNAVILLLCFSLWKCGYSHGFDKAYLEWNKEKLKLEENRKRQQAKFDAEREKMRKDSWEVSNALHGRTKKIEEETDKLIFDLRNDNYRLREKFQSCSTRSMSGTPSSTTGDDGKAESEFSRADEEFLIRLASRADKIAAQLTACQRYVNATR